MAQPGNWWDKLSRFTKQAGAVARGEQPFPWSIPSVRELGSYYGQAANTARSLMPRTPSGLPVYNPIPQQFQRPGNASAAVGALIDRLPNLSAPSGGLPGYNPIPQQFQRPGNASAAVGALMDKLPNLNAPSGGLPGYNPIPQQFQPNQPFPPPVTNWGQHFSPEVNSVISPSVNAGKPVGRVAPPPAKPAALPATTQSSNAFYPGQSEWDTAPGWLARAGGVNTGTPEGRMFEAMNRPSVPMASAAKQPMSLPWQNGQADMYLNSPQLVKPWEDPADRHAEALAQQRRRPVGGQMAGELAASAGSFRVGPNVAVPMSPETAKAIADRKAMEASNENLRRGYEALRQNQKAPAFGTVAAGRSESNPYVTNAMPWEDWVSAIKKERDMLASGIVPETPVTPWAGDSGIDRPSQAKTNEKSGIAGVLKERKAKRDAETSVRRKWIHADKRNMLPWQIGVQEAMASGTPLTADQNRAVYGPTLDKIAADLEAAKANAEAMERAHLYDAAGNAMTPSDSGSQPNVPQIIRGFSQLYQGGGLGFPPGVGQQVPIGESPSSPADIVYKKMEEHPEVASMFYRAIGDKNTDRETLGRYLFMAGVDPETASAWLDGVRPKKNIAGIGGTSQIGNPASAYQRWGG